MCGDRSDGGWDACETLTVCGFTGVPGPEVVWYNSARTLRDLGAAGIAQLSDAVCRGFITALRTN